MICQWNNVKIIQDNSTQYWTNCTKYKLFSLDKISFFAVCQQFDMGRWSNFQVINAVIAKLANVCSLLVQNYPSHPDDTANIAFHFVS